MTTNPEEATGDGIAMALRAGVPVADVEFFQFHPTALHHPAMPRPLLSEALRGHGALLRDATGERFVDELAPRDVVSRAMADRMASQGVEHLWLDATGLDAFDARFPTLAESLNRAGLDPSAQWLPIAPAAHYLSGGILTDLDGASTLPGLWAAGETACTGVHGANRLASNSLLEGMVFGARLSEAIERGRTGPEATGAMRAASGSSADGPAQGHSAGIPCDSASIHDYLDRTGLGDGPSDRIEPGRRRRGRRARRRPQGPGAVAAGHDRRRRGSAVAGLAPSGRCRGRRRGVAGGGPGCGKRAAGEASPTCARGGRRPSGRGPGPVEDWRGGAAARRDHPDTRPEWRRRLVLAGPSPAGADTPGAVTPASR